MLLSEIDLLTSNLANQVNHKIAENSSPCYKGIYKPVFQLALEPRIVFDASPIAPIMDSIETHTVGNSPLNSSGSVDRASTATPDKTPEPYFSDSILHSNNSPQNYVNNSSNEVGSSGMSATSPQFNPVMELPNRLNGMEHLQTKLANTNVSYTLTDAAENNFKRNDSATLLSTNNRLYYGLSSNFEFRPSYDYTSGDELEDRIKIQQQDRQEASKSLTPSYYRTEISLNKEVINLDQNEKDTDLFAVRGRYGLNIEANSELLETDTLAQFGVNSMSVSIDDGLLGYTNFSDYVYSTMFIETDSDKFVNLKDIDENSSLGLSILISETIFTYTSKQTHVSENIGDMFKILKSSLGFPVDDLMFAIGHDQTLSNSVNNDQISHALASVYQQLDQSDQFDQRITALNDALQLKVS